MKPNVDEVRWLLFEDDELTELKVGLKRTEEDDENTTEGDCLLISINEEIKNRENGDGVWCLRT
jgi:hypothetical protein